jgi:diguanylate cyclase (GGDEF)-like protein
MELEPPLHPRGRRGLIMRSLKQVWARAVGDDVAGYFPFAYHRLVLGLLLAVALVVQTMLSIDASRPDELVDRQVLASESDANSVVTVQRESFNVAIALSEWGHGGASAREVQVARALLSQRLNVVTKSRTLTAENVGRDYLAALAALDEIILGLTDVPAGSEMVVLAEAEPVIAAFLTETRALNEVFQQLAREQIQLVVEANRERQRVQTILQLFVVLLVGLLSLSIVVAIGRGYRRVVTELSAQRLHVAQARRELDLVRDLDAGIAPLLQAVDSGTPARIVRASLKGMLDALPTGHVWTVPDGSAGEVVPTPITAPDPTPEGAVARGPGPLPAPLSGDLGLVAARAQGVVDALRRREEAARAADAARRRDPLTGLANRLGFADDLGRLLEERPGQPVVVCFLDIDRFGEVNGALGFAGADRVLVELAERLTDALRSSPGSIVARMAADEFAVAVVLDSEPHSVIVVDGLRAAGTYLSTAGGMEAAISVSAGEAVGVSGELDATELMRRAAVAMLLAKESSDRRGHVRFDALAHGHLSSTLVDELAVRNALRAGEFRMHYQPIVDIATGRAVGLEALSRWERPGVGLVPPGEFLPVIQRSGFAVEFGFEVITEVITAWKRSLRSALVAASGPTAYVSVNVDAIQLADPGFEAFVLSALERAHMEPRELVLELTEHTAIDRTHAPMLDRLRAVGVRIAVDDFGSGFSSLGQSTQLPVDLLKLDRSFVAGLLASDHDLGIFADLARLSTTLGTVLIAEGIETEEVADMLLTAGIATGQGFLYSPALPESDAVRWVVSSRGVALPGNLPDPVTAGG